MLKKRNKIEQNEYSWLDDVLWLDNMISQFIKRLFLEINIYIYILVLFIISGYKL